MLQSAHSDGYDDGGDSCLCLVFGCLDGCNRFSGFRDPFVRPIS